MVMVNTLFFSSLILFFPGYLLSNILFKKNKLEIDEKLPVYFTFTTVLIMLPSLTAYISGYSLRFIMHSAGVIIISLIICNIWRTVLNNKKMTGSTGIEPDYSYGERSVFIKINLLIMLVVSCVVMVKAGAYMVPTSDSLGYLAGIRKIVLGNVMSVYDPYYAGTKDPAAAFGTWQVIIAVIGRVSGEDIVKIWRFLPVILVPLSINTHYIFAKNIFRNRIAALISTLILFMIGITYRNMQWWQEIVYSSWIARLIILPVVLLFMLKYIYGKTDAKKYLLAGALAGLSLAVFHVYYYLLVIFSILSFLVFYILYMKHKTDLIRRIMRYLAVVVLAALPFIILRYTTSYGIMNPRFLVPEGIIKLSDTLFIIDILGNLKWHMFIPLPLFVLSVILALLILSAAKKDNASIFLMSNMLFPLLVMINPVIVPVIGKYLSVNYVSRMLRIMPSVMVIGYCLNKALSFCKNMGIYKFVPVVLIYITLGISIKGFDSLPVRRGIVEIMRKTAQILENNGIKKESVIFSDPVVSYNLGAFLDIYAVAINSSHASPMAQDQEKRFLDSKSILDPGTNIKQTVGLLKEYNVSYIVLIPELFNHLRLIKKYNDISDDFIENLDLNKFEKHSEIFNKIHSEQGIYIYRIDYDKPQIR